MPLKGLLEGKTAVLTGGTTGIGRAITLGFLSQGCSVAINHLGLAKDDPHLQTLIAEAEDMRSSDANTGRLEHIVGDVRDPASAQQLVELALSSFGTGRLDICVSNAGICTFASLLDLDHGLFTNTVRTNLDGAFYIVQVCSHE
jgi:L-rhamnose 1-dehydrogenase